MSCVSPRMLGFASVIAGGNAAGSDPKRPRISTFHTPAAPITYIRVKSTSVVERTLKAALRAGLRFVRHILEIGRLQLLATAHVFGV